MDSISKLKFLCWNVRGLNEKDKRVAVKQTVLLEKPDVLRFQETKLNQVDDTIIKEAC